MKKENIALVIFLAFIFGAGVYFYTLPTVSQDITGTNPVVQEVRKGATTPHDVTTVAPQVKVSTEGWKTCRNEEYGYEFNYPAEWNIYNEKESYPDPKKLEGIQDPGAPVYVQPGKNCVGGIITMSNGPLHEELQKSTPPNNGEIVATIEVPNGKNVTISKTTVSVTEQNNSVGNNTERTTKKYLITPPHGINYINNSSDTNRVVNISIRYSLWGSAPMSAEVFETILSTFKFIN
jgi:hypothetical protein